MIINLVIDTGKMSDLTQAADLVDLLVLEQLEREECDDCSEISEDGFYSKTTECPICPKGECPSEKY